MNTLLAACLEKVSALISPWFVPRKDYDLRLELINETDRENRAMLLVHKDYVEAQLRAPLLHRTKLPDHAHELAFYRQSHAWPPLFADPSVLDVEMTSCREEHRRLHRFHCEIQIDEATLAHFRKYSAGMFREVARPLLLHAVEGLIRE